MTDAATLSRRSILAAAALAVPSVALAVPKAGRLRFSVLRNGERIGEHDMSFSGAPGNVVVRTAVDMTVKLGPVPVYRYRHQATERWVDGRFNALETTTNGNGRVRKVVARREDQGVLIEAGRRQRIAPATAAPFTHWNPAVFDGPLFNPQEGTLLKIRASRGPGGDLGAVRWTIRGEAEIDDWYDANGDWTALRGRLEDGSILEYRRL